MDLTNNYYFTAFKSQYDILKFIALIVLPAISKGISYSYVSKKMGYKPVIAFDLVFTLYKYILPFIPNPSEYVVAIIYLIIPVLFAFRIIKFFEEREKQTLPSDYKKIKLKGLLLPFVMLIVMVYFYSGYFRYYAIAIASGSMQKQINKGDIVIVDKKYSFNALEEGQVIAYRKNGVIIVHRIVKKLKLGDSYVYYTKGDANDNVDDFVIEEDMVVGKVNHKIPYIGYPTVWFNNK
jgi:signal peptidase